jgi:hypothetical protein
MTSVLGGLIVNAGNRARPDEILQQAYEYALKAKQFEKENFQ